MMDEREQRRAIIQCMLRARVEQSAAERAAGMNSKVVSSPGPEKPQTEDEKSRQALRVQRIDREARRLFEEGSYQDGELTIH